MPEGEKICIMFVKDHEKNSTGFQPPETEKLVPGMIKNYGLCFSLKDYYRGGTCLSAFV